MAVRSLDSFMKDLPDYQKVLTSEQILSLKKYYREYAAWAKIYDDAFNNWLHKNQSGIDYSTTLEKDMDQVVRWKTKLEQEAESIIANYYENHNDMVNNIDSESEEEKNGMNM